MNFTDRDLEILSAYIDGEISTKDREKLKTRLSEDAGLRKTLEELQSTRQVIRSLPSLRAPRNYFVSAEMVGQKETASRAFPVLRFASVLASVIFVLLFLGDILIPRSGVLPAPMAARVSESIIEEAEMPAAESVQREMETEAPAAVEGEAIELPVAEAPQFESESPEMQDEQRIEFPEAGEEAAAPEPLPPNVSPSEPAGDMERMAVTGVPAPLEEPGDELGGMAKSLEEPNLLEDGGVISIPLEEPSQQVISIWSVVRFFEFFFIVVALVTGLTALFLSRRGSTLS